MEELNTVEVKKETAVKIADLLNNLLADYQVFYQNLRGFHWNIKGMYFFGLHQKFEELYTDAAEKIDEIAERILTLGFTPYHSFEDYLSHTKLKSAKNISEGKQAVTVTLENIKHLLNQLNEVKLLADEKDDYGTSVIVDEIISSFEKTSWMLKSFLA